MDGYESDPLFNNADGYFRYFLNNEIRMMISTVSIAEYCVGGSIDELPLRNLQVVPFNLDHSKRAGTFGSIIFHAKRYGQVDFSNRNIIPNDTKLFAQADCEKSVGYYLSSDSQSSKMYHLLKRSTELHFQFIDLNTPYHSTFGVLDL